MTRKSQILCGAVKSYLKCERRYQAMSQITELYKPCRIVTRGGSYLDRSHLTVGEALCALESARLCLIELDKANKHLKLLIAS